MRQIWIGTTWKMNKTLSEAMRYFEYIKKNLPLPDRMRIFLVLPFTLLSQARDILTGTGILLGAQNMHWETAGEFTGEISPLMLADIGVDLVELGHSERRTYFNEDDYSVNKKVLAALAHNLIPLICVGEHLIEKEHGVAKEVVSRQVKIALHGVREEHCERILIAYEPVWAIGKQGIPASAQDADEIQAHIREVLIQAFGPKQGQKVPILYGGSVQLANASSFVMRPNVDGLFIGRAGLEPQSFLDILYNTRASLPEPE